jgi:hypothetical protein
VAAALDRREERLPGRRAEGQMTGRGVLGVADSACTIDGDDLDALVAAATYNWTCATALRHGHVPTRLTPIDQDYEHLRADMATLFSHLGIQPGPATA